MNSLLPSEEAILISPRRRSPEDASPNKRRKFTPSPESFLSNNFLVISPISSVRSQPLFAPSDFSPSFAADLFPGAEATIELRCPLRSLPHGHPEPDPQGSLIPGNTLPSSRQRELPQGPRLP